MPLETGMSITMYGPHTLYGYIASCKSIQAPQKKLVRNVETWVTSSMKAGKITPEEGREFLSRYRSGLYGYTYLEKD